MLQPVDTISRTYDNLLKRFPELNFYVQKDVVWLQSEVESMKRFRDELIKEDGNTKRLTLDERIEVLSKTFALEVQEA